MIILGIETSCDETAAAVVQDGTKTISNVVASSQSLHAKYGGIIPDKAAREQLKSILAVIHEALQQSSVHSSLFTEKNTHSAMNRELESTVNRIDAITVTVGPGLIGSLLVGVETAKALAFAWHKPIIPINHLIGHIYANWLTSADSTWQIARGKDNSANYELRATRQLPRFPALVLLVSGGHTELILMKDHGKFKLLGSTRDDAAGECFDKCARLLNLGYPGGPAIEKASMDYRPLTTDYCPKLPRPMINDKNLDFSFSGLKTALARRSPSEGSPYLAHDLQEAVTDVLVSKTLKAAQKYSPKSILLAGGVAANSRLRDKLRKQLNAFRFPLDAFFVPPINLCTDNAACTASAAFFNYHPLPISKINADPGLNL